MHRFLLRVRAAARSSFGVFSIIGQNKLLTCLRGMGVSKRTLIDLLRDVCLIVQGRIFHTLLKLRSLS